MFFSTKSQQENANNFVTLVLKTVIYISKLLIFKTSKVSFLTFSYLILSFRANTTYELNKLCLYKEEFDRQIIYKDKTQGTRKISLYFC